MSDQYKIGDRVARLSPKGKADRLGFVRVVWSNGVQVAWDDFSAAEYDSDPVIYPFASLVRLGAK